MSPNSPSGSPRHSQRAVIQRLSSSKRRLKGLTVEQKDAGEHESESRLLEELPNSERNQLADGAEILRYIRASGGNEKEALRRLQETFAWRAKERPETLSCTACQKEPRSHYMHVVGHDLHGRPVIYSCLRNVTNRIVEDNRLHMLATFQQAIRLMPAGVSQWIWVCDFSGFGYNDVDPSMAKIFLHFSAQHYPERLAHFFVVDAPTVFNLLWKIVQPWVDPVTRAKLTFCGQKPDATFEKACHQQHFSDELIAWLKAEMAENRDSKLVKKKVYDYDQLADLAKQPQEAGRKEGSEQHSVYGTPTFIQTLRQDPSVLKPLAIT